MENSFTYKLLGNDFNLNIKKIGSPKLLIISGISTIIIGLFSIFRLITGGELGAALWITMLLLVVTLIFLNSYSSYSHKVAINSPVVTEINFTIRDSYFSTSIDYFIPADKKGPRNQFTKFDFDKIESITYSNNKKALTILSRYKSIISFDNPNIQDITNDYENASHYYTVEYMIDLNKNYDLLNSIKNKSNIMIEIF